MPTTYRGGVAARDANAPGAAPWVPPGGDVASLRAAVPGCRGCELWAPATQAVFSDGPDDARIMLVGEQPGDREDREGRPFVGPAGRELHDALAEAGLNPEAVYVTNAVKHFRFEPCGARRVHKKPGVAHVRACHPWLDAELAAVPARVVVCLGATAARAVLGRAIAIGDVRGQVLPLGDGGPRAVVTAHPSSVVRLRGRDGWQGAHDALVADLATAGRAAAGG